MRNSEQKHILSYYYIIFGDVNVSVCIIQMFYKPGLLVVRNDTRNR